MESKLRKRKGDSLSPSLSLSLPLSLSLDGKHEKDQPLTSKVEKNKSRYF